MVDICSEFVYLPLRNVVYLFRRILPRANFLTYGNSRLLEQSHHFIPTVSFLLTLFSLYSEVAVSPYSEVALLSD